MKTAKSITSAVALFAMTGQAWAGDACVTSRDATALKAAALQQELMVAALTCNDISRYNHFVVSYRSELQGSDKALQAYFLRVSAQSGVADYHAYKTRLANQSSLDSVHDDGYCAKANMAFEDALEGPRASLAELVANETVSGADDFVPCDESVAGNSSEIPFVRTASRRNWH